MKQRALKLLFWLVNRRWYTPIRKLLAWLLPGLNLYVTSTVLELVGQPTKQVFKLERR
jgi:hypothetical protein